MSFNWDKICEKITTLYEEMEYHSAYNIERFIKDYESIEKSETVWIHTDPECESQHDYNWISRFKDVLEDRRSILTKIFDLTNNFNAVETLIEHCDYYRSYYYDREANDMPVLLPKRSATLLRSVLAMMANGSITERVWNMLYEDAGTSPHHCISEAVPLGGRSAMVVMADADLNAVVQALVASRLSFFHPSQILVQEPIKKQFLDSLRDHEGGIEIFSDFLFVFRNTTEAIEALNVKDKFQATSIWSENIIAAKKFSNHLEINTIWINAHGVVGAGFHSLVHTPAPFSDSTFWVTDFEKSADSPPKIVLGLSKTYDLFYGGNWQKPADEKYWSNQAGVGFARATEKDINNCVDAARGGFKIWRNKKFSERAKIIRRFAERIMANGESDYADIVQQLIDRPWEFRSTLSIVREGAAEILSTPKPVGVVAISSADEKMLFKKFIIASITGNSVIILSKDGRLVQFARYCDFLGTSGFPPGVISHLCIADTSESIIDEKLFDGILPESIEFELPKKYANFYKPGAIENIVYNDFFKLVTKPKSVWLQCD